MNINIITSSLLTGVKPYSCSICHKKFRQNRNLRVHERIHAKPAPSGNTCKHCQRQFKLKRELRCHEKECTGQQITYILLVLTLNVINCIKSY